MFLFLNSNSIGDIRDFQLEGISIGDSFLDYYTKETQKKLKFYNSGDTKTVKFKDSDFKIYDELQVSFEGKNQIINSISGIIYIQESYGKKKFEECLILQTKVTNQIKDLKPIKVVYGKDDKPTDKDFSKVNSNELFFSDNGSIKVRCLDFTSSQEKDMNWKDSLVVSIEKKKINLENIKENNNDNSLVVSSDSKVLPLDFEENILKFSTDEKFHALLIANSDYEYWQDLESPINDVNSISSILKNDYGFDVEVLNNASRDVILDKLYEYSSKLSHNDNLLIYYSGHGEILNSNAYWIPIDATKKISSKWLSTKDVDSAISMISTKDLLVMVDSCYQGTAFKSASTKVIGPTINEMNDEKFFNKMLKIRSRIVITSGNNEPVVDATIKGHSHFAFKFIDILKNNNTYETSTNIYVELKKYHVSLNQNPNYIRVITWGDLGGDFVFLKK